MCTVHESKKKKNYFILPHPLKNYLIFSLTPCPSLSFSLSLSVTQLSSSPKTLSISQAFILSQSLSSHRRWPHRPKPPTDRLTVPSRRSPHHPMPPIASPSHAANRLTVTLLSANPAHQPTPSTDPPLLSTQLTDPPFVCDW